jgi:hypothetical protein
MARSERNGRGQRRVGTRTGVLGMCFGLVAGLMTAVFGAGPAAAAAIACPGGPGVQWVVVGGRPPIWQAYVYTLHTTTQVFNVSETRTVDNTLDTPVSATFISNKSSTYTLQVTAGTSASLAGFLTANVSVTIVQSRTTAIGVSATATVPPRSRVNGLYGVVAYDITYDAHRYRYIGSSAPKAGERKCGVPDVVTGQTTNAPTYVEGWRIVTA